MHRILPTAATALLAALTLPTASSLQRIPKVLIKEGDPLPGTSGSTFTGLAKLDVAPDGAYAATLITGEPWNPPSVIWGDLAGGDGGVLRVRSTIAGIEQLGFDDGLAVRAGGLTYSSQVTFPSGAPGYVLWRDDTPLLQTGDPGPEPGTLWASLFGVSALDDGTPRFTGSLAPGLGGADQTIGQFLGIQGTSLVTEGAPLPPGNQIICSTGGDTTDVSSDGAHSIFTVTLLSGSSCGFNETVVMDGAPLVVDGSPIREGAELAPSLGFPGSRWGQVYGFGVNRGGSYWVAADVLGLPREAILIDGEIRFYVDAPLSTGTWERFRDGRLLEDGNFLHVAGYRLTQTTFETGLFFNQSLLLSTGSPVDYDGDGSVDPEWTVSSFTLTTQRGSTFGMDSDWNVYVAASVTNGTIREKALLRLTADIGETYCDAVPNSTGAPAELRAIGSDVAAEHEVQFLASSLPNNSSGYFLVGDQAAQVPMAGGSSGILCIGGEIGRFVGLFEIQNSGSSGTFQLNVDPRILPRPNGFHTAVAGETWYFSAWYRDAVMGQATSNFTNGVALEFR